MRNPNYDKMKSMATIKKEMSYVCKVPGCNKPLTTMSGPGMDILCRDHQLYDRAYGGMGRYDRLWTYHRKYTCDDCGYNALEDPRLQDVKNEDDKRRIARSLMHGDHLIRKADGGQDTAENIRSRCVVCHNKKTILSRDHLSGEARRLALEEDAELLVDELEMN